MAKEVTQEIQPELSAPQPELRECSFMIPMEMGGQDATELHRQITFQVAARFGGCFSCPVVGAWRNDVLSGEAGMAMIQVEGMLIVTSAISAPDETDFHDFALASARVFKQEALYWQSRDGVSHVETIITGRLN